MARIAGNRVRESTTTTGTGDIALGGADSGFRPFSAACANGDIVGYAIFTSASALWEVGEGTYNTGPNTLTRTFVISSSNANALVSLPAGSKTIILTKPAEQERRLLPPLRTFPAISGLVCRLSAEFSTMTLNTDDRVASLGDISGVWGAFTATTSARPRWRREAMCGIRPGIIFDGLATRLTASAKTLAQPFTVVAVFSRWRAASGSQDMYRDSNSGPVFFRNGGTQWAIFAGAGVTSTALYDQNIQGELNLTSEAAPACSIQVYNNASSILSNNGVEVTGTAGSTGFSGTLFLGSNNTGTFGSFVLYEFLIYNSALGPSDRALLNAYYANALDLRL